MLIFKLCSLTICQEHGRALCLPSGDRLWPTGLANNIHCLPDPNVDGKQLQVLVECHEESGVHGGDKEVEEVVVFGEDELLGVNHRHEDSKETGSGHARENLAVRVEGVEACSALAHVQQTLSNANHKQ